MFVISKDTVGKILSGELGYDERSYDEDNEVSKGFHFEDQAKVNLALEKHHEAVCSALEEKCRKESCAFYKLGTGKLKEGWA